MPDGHRRSREGWADTMEAGPSNPPAHTHRLPPLVRVAIVGLGAAVFLLLIAVGFLTVYVYQQQQYIQGRGVQRDRENVQLQERIRMGVCDLLDQLPEGGLLERPRHKYHCGPGIPFEDLTPGEQQQVQGANPSVVPQLPSGVQSIPGLPGGATPQPAPPQPYFPTPGVAEPPATVPYPPGFPPPDPAQPSASPTPLVDLGPVTCPLVGLGC